MDNKNVFIIINCENIEKYNNVKNNNIIIIREKKILNIIILLYIILIIKVIILLLKDKILANIGEELIIFSL